jgi:biotin synthase
MCYAIPGKVVKIELKKCSHGSGKGSGNIAIIEYFGEHRKALNEYDDLKVGEYVYAQGGVVVNRIPEQDALEILDIWKEKFFELKKADKELSSITKNNKDVSTNLLAVLQKVNLRKKLTNDDLRYLLSIKDKNELRLLYETSNNVRQKIHDNACCVHGIIEFSNNCRQNCEYCGIRRDAKINRYRMTKEEIIETAKNAAEKLNFKALVLQSGEDEYYSDEMLCEIIKEIRKLNVLIFVSFGVRSKESYKKFYDAGARAILLRFETSNKKLFETMRKGTSFDERIELIKYAKKLGYVIATGFIIGLPGETDEDLLNNILLAKSLEPDMYSFGPLIPTKGTPLENINKTDVDTVLKIIAVTRLNDVDCNILVTTALETLSKDAKRKALMAGGNSLMINVTPYKYRALYGIYENRSDRDIEIEDNIEETINLLYSLGRAPTDIGL